MNLLEAFQELGLKYNLSLVILTMALLIARIVPVIVLSPFLGGDVVPTEVKLGLAAMVALTLYPAVADRVTQIPTSAFPFIAVLMKEIFIGVSLAFIVSSVFEAAQIGGTLVDTMAGTNQATVMVPQIQQQVSLFSSLQIQLSVVLFLTLNGHHLVIQALAESLELIPLDSFPAFSGGAWAFFDIITRTFANLLMIGLALSAPAFLATFLTDLSLGMVNRVATQLQVFFVSMQIKPVVAVMMMLTSIHLIMGRMTDEFIRMLEQLFRALHVLA